MALRFPEPGKPRESIETDRCRRSGATAKPGRTAFALRARPKRHRRRAGGQAAHIVPGVRHGVSLLIVDLSNIPYAVLVAAHGQEGCSDADPALVWAAFRPRDAPEHIQARTVVLPSHPLVVQPKRFDRRSCPAVSRHRRDAWGGPGSCNQVATAVFGSIEVSSCAMRTVAVSLCGFTGCWIRVNRPVPLGLVVTVNVAAAADQGRCRQSAQPVARSW